MQCLVLLVAIPSKASGQTAPTRSRLLLGAAVGAGIAFSRSARVGGMAVSGGGAVVPPALHVAADVFLTEAVTAGASVRYQIIAGDVPWLVQARLAYWLELGSNLRSYARIGGGYGSIEPQITIPDASGTEVTEFQSSGLANLAAAGGVYWDVDDPSGLGLLAELEADYFFPRRLTAFELRVGVAYGF